MFTYYKPGTRTEGRACHTTKLSDTIGVLILELLEASDCGQQRPVPEAPQRKDRNRGNSKVKKLADKCTKIFDCIYSCTSRCEYSSQISNNEPVVNMNEFSSLRQGHSVDKESTHAWSLSTAGVVELPTNYYNPTVSELDSEPHTCRASMSSGPAPSGMTWLANWPSLAVSADQNGMTTLRSPIERSSPIPLGESPSMGSTTAPCNMISLGVYDGVGPETLQRQGSHHSQNSQSTLIGGLSGRQSPMNGQVYRNLSSAFQSPELQPQRVPNRRPVPQAQPLSLTPSESNDVLGLGIDCGIIPAVSNTGSYNSQSGQFALRNDTDGQRISGKRRKRHPALPPMAPGWQMSSTSHEPKMNGELKETQTGRCTLPSKDHYLIEVERGVFQCGCGVPFSGDAKTARSNAMRHIDSQTASHPCRKGCGKTFKRTDNRNKHEATCSANPCLASLG